MKLRGIALILGLAFAGLASAQRLVRLGVHPAVTAPIRLIAAEFQKSHKDVVFEFLTLDSERAQIRLGPESNANGRMFAINRLVLVAPAESERITKFAHIGLEVKLALPQPKTFEGLLAQQVIDQAANTYGRDWEANVKKNGRVKADGSAEAVGLVLESKADAALALSTDVIPHKDKLRLIPLPADLGRAVQMEACITERSSLSNAFVEFLFRRGNQQRLVAHGFASPISPVAELNITYPGSMTKLFTAALGTLKQEKVGSAKGASLRAIMKGNGSKVKFVGADGSTLLVPMSSIRRSGGVLSSMGDGNYQILLPGRTPLRWLRRIVVS